MIDVSTQDAKEILLFESCLNDLLVQFVKQQIVSIKDQDFDFVEDDFFYEISDIDFEAEFQDWLSKKIANFVNNVNWEKVTQKIAEATE